jgi:hypothetical protein
MSTTQLFANLLEGEATSLLQTSSSSKHYMILGLTESGSMHRIEFVLKLLKKIGICTPKGLDLDPDPHRLQK